MTVRLRLRRSNETIREYEFDRKEVSIGRGPLNDLVLGDAGVARVHGTLRFRDGGELAYEPEAESCDTTVLRDGEPLSGADGDEMFLLPGDVIRLELDEPMELEILDAVESIPFEFRTVPIPDGDHTATRQEARRLAEEPTYGALLWVLTQRVAALLSGHPEQIDLVVFSGPEEYHNHVVTLEGEDDVAPTCDPLRAVARKSETLMHAMSEEDALVAFQDGTYRIFAPLRLRGELGGCLALALEQSITTQQLEALAVHIASLRPLASLVLERQHLGRRLEGLSEENRYFRDRQRRHYLFKELICESPKMREVYDDLNDCVDDDTPMLLSGEAGTGKELLARALHHLGPRKDGLLISISCGHASKELLDFELFGCVKSELSGAVAPRKGVFELARNGTVFLEEIDLLSPLMQGKLVRMLKEGEIRRVGDAVGRPVDARLIASIHRDLDTVVEEGRLRRDLYLLLEPHMLAVPSLREREEDVMPLARNFLRLYAQRYEKNCSKFADEVVERLCSYDWPGNVRELQTRVEAAVLKSEGDVVTVEHLGL